MHLLGDRDAEAVRARLASLAGPVSLAYFTESSSGLVIPGRECRSCGETQRLLGDLAVCSPLVTLEVHDRFLEPDVFTAYGIDKVPGVAVLGATDYGVRYYGMPAGYELRNLLDVMVDVSRGGVGQDPGLAQETRGALSGLAADVRMQVLVTPT